MIDQTISHYHILANPGVGGMGLTSIPRFTAESSREYTFLRRDKITSRLHLPLI